MSPAPRYRPSTAGALIYVNGLIGCAGALALQWLIGYPLFEHGSAHMWTALSSITNLAARYAVDNGISYSFSALWRHLYFPLWSIAIVAFAMVYWRLAHRQFSLSSKRLGGLLSLQFVIMVVAGDVLPKIFAMQLPLILPVKRAFGWLMAGWIAMAAMNFLVLSHLFHTLDASAFVRLSLDFAAGVALDITFFAFGILAARERKGRAELESAHARLDDIHAELLNAQLQLGERVRAAERMRIATRLHAAIDKMLAEQRVHLEGILPEKDATSFMSVNAARDMSSALLNEVNKLIEIAPHEPAIDLRKILDALCAGIPFPIVSLNFDESLGATTPATANTILRCVQEAITNTVRHAHARKLMISLSSEDTRILVRIYDDGIGVSASGNSARHDSAEDEPVSSDKHPGNGLQGMLERAEALGGTFTYGNCAEGGFEICMSLPIVGESRHTVDDIGAAASERLNWERDA
jgi:signal transduction histidine kinase